MPATKDGHAEMTQLVKLRRLAAELLRDDDEAAFGDVIRQVEKARKPKKVEGK